MWRVENNTIAKCIVPPYFNILSCEYSLLDLVAEVFKENFAFDLYFWYENFMIFLFGHFHNIFDEVFYVEESVNLRICLIHTQKLICFNNKHFVLWN